MPAKTSEDLKIIKGGIRNLKEEILEFKDEILGEVKAMREELTVALGQYSRHEDTLENHPVLFLTSYNTR